MSQAQNTSYGSIISGFWVLGGIALLIVALITVPNRDAQEQAIKETIPNLAYDPAIAQTGLSGLAAQIIRGSVNSLDVSWMDLLQLRYQNYGVVSVLFDKHNNVVSVGAFKQVHVF